jgi:hypothetical protein
LEKIATAFRKMEKWKCNGWVGKTKHGYIRRTERKRKLTLGG